MQPVLYFTTKCFLVGPVGTLARVIYKVYDKFIIGGNKSRRFCGVRSGDATNLLEGRKAHSALVRPTQNSPASPTLRFRPTRSPDGACSPISRSVSRPRFRSDGGGREGETASVGLMRRQRPIERTAGGGRGRALSPLVPPSAGRRSVGGAMGITATDRPFAR